MFKRYTTHLACVTCDHGSVLLWQRYLHVYVGVVDDVVFAHYRPDKGRVTRRLLKVTHQWQH